MKVAFVIIIGLLATGYSHAVASESFEGSPAADTYLWASNPDMSYGGSPHLATGNGSNVYNDDRFRCLIRWELPETLAGAHVLTARVNLPVRYNSPGAGTLETYLLKTPWNESATWNTRDGEHPWPGDSGAMGATTMKILARTEVRNIPANTNGELPTGETVSIDITEIARSWAAGSPNEGLLLRMVHTQYTQGIFCTYSREMNPSNLRPILSIEYEPKERR